VSKTRRAASIGLMEKKQGAIDGGSYSHFLKTDKSKKANTHKEGTPRSDDK